MIAGVQVGVLTFNESEGHRNREDDGEDALNDKDLVS
jgi:hypothetical protein